MSLYTQMGDFTISLFVLLFLYYARIIFKVYIEPVIWCLDIGILVNPPYWVVKSNFKHGLLCVFIMANFLKNSWKDFLYV